VRFFLRIEDFDEQGKTALFQSCRAQQFRPVILDQPVKVLAASGPLAMTLTSPERSLISHDSPIERRAAAALIQALQLASTPDALFEDRMKG